MVSQTSLIELKKEQLEREKNKAEQKELEKAIEVEKAKELAKIKVKTREITEVKVPKLVEVEPGQRKKKEAERIPPEKRRIPEVIAKKPVSKHKKEEERRPERARGKEPHKIREPEICEIILFCAVAV